jgi:nicotinamide-nucleotide amidase
MSEPGALPVEQLVERLSAFLLARQLMMSCAESCTGGLIAAALTEQAGSSAWFERGFVTYSNQAKIESLWVPAPLIEQYGAVSEACARAMAEGARTASSSACALSVTGIAGPSGGTPEKPVGTVCFGFSSSMRPALAVTHHFEGDRSAVRRQSVHYALKGLLAFLENRSIDV